MKLSICLSESDSAKGSNINVSYVFRKAVNAFINGQTILPSKLDSDIVADPEDTLGYAILKCIPVALKNADSKIAIYETKDGTKLKACVISGSKIIHDNASSFRIVPDASGIIKNNKPLVYKSIGNTTIPYFPYLLISYQTLQKHVKG